VISADPTQTVPPQQVKHVLRALLYAIFFHRLMDNVEPETWDILETHVVS
jgi:autophagy-related protein 101